MYIFHVFFIHLIFYPQSIRQIRECLVRNYIPNAAFDPDLKLPVLGHENVDLEFARQGAVGQNKLET